MNKKGFGTIFVIIGVLVILGLVGGAYYFGIRQNQPIPQQQATASPTTIQTPPTNLPTQSSNQEVSAIPSDWIYKTNTDCSVRFPIPPKKEPYYSTPNANRQPSVTNDEGSGRFWDYPRGVFYSNLLSKLIGANEQYKQAATTYATEAEASGYISAAVVVSCAENKGGLNNKQLLELLKENIQKYNQTSSETMEASKYTIETSKEVKKWDKEALDLTVSEYFKNSGGQPYTNTVNYVMFATNSKIYEVKKVINSKSTSVQETADKIFNNLQFPSN